jgi:hypothetical protein
VPEMERPTSELLARMVKVILLILAVILLFILIDKFFGFSKFLLSEIKNLSEKLSGLTRWISWLKG